MKPTEGLSDEAHKLLDVMIEEFRKIMASDWDAGEFRAAVLELIDAGLAKIYQRGDDFSLRLTPEAEAMFKAAP